MGRVLTAVMAVLIAGCAGATANRDSPAYNAGFSDGCATASAEGSGVPKAPQRDAALYQQDADYRAGWASGHASCARPNAHSP
jgi:hypothetical protein